MSDSVIPNAQATREGSDHFNTLEALRERIASLINGAMRQGKYRADITVAEVPLEIQKTLVEELRALNYTAVAHDVVKDEIPDIELHSPGPGTLRINW